MNDILSVMRGIGLSENEARVYLACLELGPSSIWEIAKKSAVKRPTCYFILGELALRGLASSVDDGRRVSFSVSSPKVLRRAIAGRFERFDRAIPELEGLASLAHAKPVITLFEGIEGIKNVYNLTLDQAKESEILIYGTATVEANYGPFIADYLKGRKDKKISVRAILPDMAENRGIAERDAAELRETRFIDPAKFPQKTEVNIFGDSVAYIAHSESEPFATVIENATLASEEKARFELIWLGSKN